MRRIDSEAFYTPELDAAIAASLCPAGGVVASVPAALVGAADRKAEPRRPRLRVGISSNLYPTSYVDHLSK